MFVVIALINRWKTRQVDFVLVYPQGPLEYDIYMELPKGVKYKFGIDKVMWLNKNLYKKNRPVVSSTSSPRRIPSVLGGSSRALMTAYSTKEELSY